MIVRLRNKKMVLYSTVIVGLALFIMLTSPEKLPAVFLIVPFGGIFFLTFGLMSFMLEKFNGFTVRKKPTRNILVPLIVAIVITLIFTLSSLGQLTLRDIILVGVLSLLTSFYISRVYTSPPSSE